MIKEIFIKENIKDSYIYSRDNYVKEAKENLKPSFIFAFIMVIVSLVEIYLIVRSSFLSRIKEVGIFRAIGVKKTDIYKMFLGEIFAITTIFSMLGVIFMTYIIKGLSKLPLVGNNYYMDTSVFILVVLFIYVFNMLVGLLPVINTIRKTPAKILSRSDI